jgi:hypothetical protein
VEAAEPAEAADAAEAAEAADAVGAGAAAAAAAGEPEVAALLSFDMVADARRCCQEGSWQPRKFREARSVMCWGLVKVGFLRP